MNSTDNRVHIWTDGACSGNPGPGGWAAVLIFGTYRKEISGGVYNTTNNRMELRAIAEALRLIRGQQRDIVIHSDSMVFVGPFNNGKAAERLRQGKQVNADLWKQILELASAHNVTAEWTKGHAGTKNNERCDELATNALKNPTENDYGYEAGAAAPAVNADRDPMQILSDHFAPAIVSTIADILRENGYIIVKKI